jgi:hypothetical protein
MVAPEAQYIPFRQIANICIAKSSRKQDAGVESLE